MSAARVLQGYAADARQKGLPLFAVCLLAWVVDLATTHGLGVPRGWARFMVWNILYSLGWQFGVKRRCGSLREALYVLCGNTVLFSTIQTFQDILVGNAFVWMLVPLLTIPIIAVEYGHFRLFAKLNKEGSSSSVQRRVARDEAPTGNMASEAAKLRGEAGNNEASSSLSQSVVIPTYTVRVGHTMLDNLLTVVAAGMIGLGTAFAVQDPGARYYIFWAPLVMIFGTFFGVPHNLSHRLPHWWQKHKVHHEYRGSELNTFANFYSEFTDGLIMTYGFWRDYRSGGSVRRSCVDYR